jgi:cyclophilin family peptidyl-prolyl cis-trans isomerase
MKKFIKALAVCVVAILTFSLTACTTYTKNGSVIQDVKFDVSYVVDGETTTINSTLSLYKTFAPKTCDRIIGLVEDGFYNDTALVLSKQQDYLVVGGFDYAEDYVEKAYAGEYLKGEFTSAGRESKLRVRAGALVMIREFDSEVGSAKYDTAKASFAIVLTDSGVFTNDKFCVFGYIDDGSVKILQDALIDTAAYDETYYRARYVGDRSEEDGKLVANTGFEYYFDGTSYYYGELVAGDYDKMEYDNEESKDYSVYKKITDSKNIQDVFVLPKTPLKVKTELCNGQNNK